MKTGVLQLQSFPPIQSVVERAASLSWVALPQLHFALERNSGGRAAAHAASCIAWPIAGDSNWSVASIANRTPKAVSAEEDVRSNPVIAPSAARMTGVVPLSVVTSSIAAIGNLDRWARWRSDPTVIPSEATQNGTAAQFVHARRVTVL
jgi:hypothetical protein